jgi:lactoylglutathione lyase
MGRAGSYTLRTTTTHNRRVDASWPRDQLGVTLGAEPRFELYVYVDDLDATVERLRDPDGNPVVLVVSA